MQKLVVISSAPLVFINSKWFLYSPYEKEMQLWAKHSKSIQFCCPIWKESKNLLVSEINFSMENPIELKELNIKTKESIFKAFYSSFYNLILLFKIIKQADQIHLRCPGNIALLTCFVQIFFPNKKKIVKYAGNWDPKSKQPWSYRLQKWILSNTFLTKNIKVLVYGEWPNQSKNIIPFFTATYSTKEIRNLDFRIQKTDFQNEIKFLFVGTFSIGKQPLYALQIVEHLHKMGKNVSIDFYGDGFLKNELENYIEANELHKIAHLKGNQNKEQIIKAYQNSHFLLLPSKSEGWPKVVAEAMFWSCLPLVTPVSCVPYMIDCGERGVILEEHLEKDVLFIDTLLKNEKKYQIMSQKAQAWSREYTIERFETEVKKLLL